MMLNSIRSQLILIITIFYSAVSYSASDHNTHQSLISHQNSVVITAAIPRFFPPFYHTDLEGSPYGMAIEVLNEIDHDAGFLTKYVVKESWQDVFNAIETGEAHLIPNLGITEQRKKHYFFSKPYAKTEITIFTRKDNIIKSSAVLTNLKVGVVKNNIGNKIAKQQNYKDVLAFDSINLAFDALINKKVDAIIYPKIISKFSAAALNVKNLVHDTDITLKTIHRAIAVSKKYPAIYKKLNVALTNYLMTQDYIDTHTSWYGKEEYSLSSTELISINVLILLSIIIILKYFLKSGQLSLLSQGTQKESFIWVLTLIGILISATSIIAISTLWILYETSFNEQRLRLVDIVNSRARLIEAVARYDLKETKPQNRTIAESHERTLNQIIDAHINFKGVGKTGEFTLARRNKNNIIFVLRQRHSELVTPEPVPFDSKIAAPMRLALLGHSGTIVGKDYRNKDVLAAYEPVKILNLGIVVKVDIDELREPYIRSALYILIIVILISFFGSLLFFYIIRPVMQRIKDTEQRFHQLFLNNYTPVLLVNASNAHIIDANKAAINYYGYILDELKSYTLNTLCSDTHSKILLQIQQIIAKTNNSSILTQHRLQSGEIKDVEVLMSPVQLNNQTVIYCTILDITKKISKEKEHVRLEKDLEQARKMEALGQLTGGIAHDFNNMLGIIMGYTELTQEKLSKTEDPKISEYLKSVMTASNRAKELISSMMLFSRSGEGDYQTLNISSLVKEDIKMLRSIIPTSVEMTSDINEGLPAVYIEPVKLQQLIMNLCVNARDAMDSKGTLSIKLDWNNDVNHNCLICHEQIIGAWIDLSISDTGEGMSEDILQHIFEPFFTTKSRGKGTGMGMAVVHGIVQDLEAHIVIDSEKGKGTSIHVLFKATKLTQKVIPTAVKSTVSHEKHNETILVVDDEEGLAKFMCEMLELNGYKCKCYFSSQKALSEFNQSPEKFDLIISDQTMPELTGLEMVKEMRLSRKDIPVIIVTGYSETLDDVIAKENNIKLLSKPLPKNLLLDTVKDILTP